MAAVNEEALMAACLYVTCRQTGSPQAFQVWSLYTDRLHLDTYIKDDYTRVYQYFGISRGEMHLFSNNFESTGSRQPGKGVQEEGSPFLLQADIEGIQ